MTVLVDTNVLLRIAQPSHPLNRDALEALAAIRSLEETPCVVPQVIYEYWVVATRPEEKNGLGKTVEEARADVDKITELHRLLRDERGIYDLWSDLVKSYSVHGKNAHDARIVAAMEKHSVQKILTFNGRDFIRFANIEVITPENLLSAKK